MKLLTIEELSFFEDLLRRSRAKADDVCKHDHHTHDYREGFDKGVMSGYWWSARAFLANKQATATEIDNLCGNKDPLASAEEKQRKGRWL